MKEGAAFKKLPAGISNFAPIYPVIFAFQYITSPPPTISGKSTDLPLVSLKFLENSGFFLYDVRKVLALFGEIQASNQKEDIDGNH